MEPLKVYLVRRDGIIYFPGRGNDKYNKKKIKAYNLKRMDRCSKMFQDSK